MCPPRTEPPLPMTTSGWSCSGPHSPEAAGKQQHSHTDTLCPQIKEAWKRCPNPPNLKSINRPMSPRSLLTGKESKSQASACLHHPEPSVERGSISPSLTTETKLEAEFEVLAISKHLKWYGRVTSRKRLSPTSGQLLCGELSSINRINQLYAVNAVNGAEKTSEKWTRPTSNRPKPLVPQPFLLGMFSA